MSHVDEGRLHAFLDGALKAADPADAERVELHLASCADCRAKLDEAARLRDEAAALLGAASPPAFETPSFAAIRARAEAIAAAASAAADGKPAAQSGDGARARRSRHVRATVLGTPFNGLAWAATVVLAVGLGWLLHDTVEDPVIRPLAVSTERSRVARGGSVTDARGPDDGADLRRESAAAAAGESGAGGSQVPGPPLRVEEPRDRVPESTAEVDDAARTRRRTAAATPATPPAAAAPSEPLPGRIAEEVAASGMEPDPDGTGWRQVSIDQARRAAGGELAVLDGATAITAGVRGQAGKLEVRTVQRTARGEAIEVLQRPAADGAPLRESVVAPAEAAEGAAHAEADADEALQSVAAAPQRAAPVPAPLHSSSTVRWRGWTVTISAPVGADRLGELLAELP